MNEMLSGAVIGGLVVLFTSGLLDYLHYPGATGEINGEVISISTYGDTSRLRVRLDCKNPACSIQSFWYDKYKKNYPEYLGKHIHLYYVSNLFYREIDYMYEL